MKGASLGKEAVLAASGRAGEVAAGVGRVNKSDFFSILLGRPGVDHRGKSIPPYWSVWLQGQSPESEL